MPRCKAKRKDGEQCSGFAIAGSDFCFAHDPDAREKRDDARRRGGANNRKPETLPRKRVRLSKPQDVLALLRETAEAVRCGDLDVRVANCLAYLSQVSLRAMEAGSLAERVEKLEEAVAAQDGATGGR